MNIDETKEFIAMWHRDLDRLDSLSLTAWLRAYTNIDQLEDGSPAMLLQARVDDKLRTAADTIDQLTKERDEALSQRDEARREVCECKVHRNIFCLEQHNPIKFAQDRGWDCFEKETT